MKTNDTSIGTADREAGKVLGAVEGAKQHLGRLAEFVEARGQSDERGELELGSLLDASCREQDGRWTVLLVRDLSHPPEKVWDVLTDPRHLDQWAPFAPDRNLGRVGDLVLRMIDGDKVDEFPSRVTVAQAPEVLEYTWGEDVLRFGLETTASGTRLVLRHTMQDRNFISGVSAGWHMCLAVADRLLQGRPFGPVVGRMARAHGWDELNEGYAKALGVPPMKWPFD